MQVDDGPQLGSYDYYECLVICLSNGQVMLPTSLELGTMLVKLGVLK